MAIAVLTSALILYAFLCDGFQEGCLSVSLPDLSVLTSSPTDQIATVYTWRNVATIAGSLAMGKAIDRYDGCTLLGACLLLLGLFTAVTPWCPELLGLCVISSLAAFFCGGVTVGSFALTYKTWPNHVNVARAIIQGAGIVYIMGSAISTIAVSPFLATVHFNDVLANTTASPSHSLLNTTLESQVCTAFGISALVSLLGFGLALIIVIKQQRALSSDGYTSLERQPKSQYTIIFGNEWRLKIVMVPLVLHLVYMLVFGGLEMIMLTLTMTYTEVYLDWTVNKGALAATVLHLVRLITSIIAVLLTNAVHSFTMMITGIITLAVGALIWMLCYSYTEVITWIGIVFMGIGTGPLYPISISVANDIIPVSGTVSAYCNVAYSLGGMIFPPVAGYLLKSHGTWTFPLLALTCSVVCLTFALLSKQFVKIPRVDVSKAKPKLNINFDDSYSENMPLLDKTYMQMIEASL